jgi:NADH dehydrogenase
VIGRNVNPAHLTYPIRAISEKFGFRFVNEEVKSIDLDKGVVFASGNFQYDYLLIASGSQTNFYGNQEVQRFAYKLDDAEDAKRITEKIKEGSFDTCVISGGGYTGIEIATNLRAYLNKNSRKQRIIIVERAPSLLGPLPDWMKGYVLANLRKLEIEVLTNSVVEQVSQDKVVVSPGQVFHPAMLIWAAGVRTPDFVQNLAADKTPQGRLKVDEYLSIKPNCFVAGDSTGFAYKNSFLRMGVQFAILQSVCAASNIARSIAGKRLEKYKPLDLGYVIPMANNLSCGNILGVDLKGRLPTFLHYLMCVYRSYGFRNKTGMIKELLFG